MVTYRNEMSLRDVTDADWRPPWLARGELDEFQSA